MINHQNSRVTIQLGVFPILDTHTHIFCHSLGRRQQLLCKVLQGAAFWILDRSFLCTRVLQGFKLVISRLDMSVGPKMRYASRLP